MLHIKRLPGIAAVSAAVAMLVACGTTSPSRVRAGQTEQPVWPAVEAANPLEQSKVYPDLDAIRKIVRGLTKQDVYRLIGHPMYREGIVGVYEWDYMFSLPVGTSGQYQTCRYKLLWDDNMRASRSLWNPGSCANLLSLTAGPKPEQASTLASEPQMRATSIEVSADLLFDFDSSDLSAAAPGVIDDQVMKVLEKAERVDVLRVIGFTDRLGGDAYNMGLSRRRAESVKRYLVTRGVPAGAVHIEGRGKAEPVVDCPGANGRTLTACLSPNRRVRIEVVAR